MSLNKVMLIGNVGDDPDVRFVDKGVAVAELRLATTMGEHTEWHHVVLWKQLAELVDRHVRKGDKLYVEGYLRTRFWADSQGQQHRRTEIWAQTVELLNTKRTDGK